jgi:hypothetical protein
MPAEERHHFAQTHTRPAASARGRRPPRWRRRSSAAQRRNASAASGRHEEVRRGSLRRRPALKQPRLQTGAHEVRDVYARKQHQPAAAEHVGQWTDLQHGVCEYQQSPVPHRADQVPADHRPGSTTEWTGIWFPRRWLSRVRRSVASTSICVAARSLRKRGVRAVAADYWFLRLRARAGHRGRRCWHLGRRRAIRWRREHRGQLKTGPQAGPPRVPQTPEAGGRQAPVGGRTSTPSRPTHR